MAVIFSIVFIYLLGFGIIIPILPILSRDFGASALQTGLLMSVYSLMQFIFAPMWGMLSDHYGRRPILLWCILCEGLSYILFALAENLTVLFAARILAGFFGASIGTASAYISDITPPHERTKGMAIIGVAFGLGFVFGPALGGGLAAWGEAIMKTSPQALSVHFPTSFAMYWVAGLCFLAFTFGWFKLSESLPQEKRQHRRQPRFKLMIEKLSLPVVGPMISVYFISGLGMACMEASLVLFVSDRFFWGVKETSFGFAYIGVMIVVTQGLIVRKLLPAIGERLTLRLGLTSLGCGLALTGLSHSISMMALAMTLIALGTGISNPPSLGGVSLLPSHDDQGSTLGVAQSMASLGRILGPAIGGAAYQWKAESPFLLGAALVGLALLWILSLGDKIPDSARRKS
ncbi:MAG: MFS transporter [Bdellovibrionaceae bacterium]|nr:MFS transporter [Pseudobdellovibrionaceae bacterium]